MRRTQYTAFHEQEDVWVTQVEFPTKEGKRKHGVFRGPSVQKNEKGSFSSHISDQELKETVDHKSLKDGATNQPIW
jgi:hypothetical protein